MNFQDPGEAIDQAKDEKESREIDAFLTKADPMNQYVTLKDYLKSCPPGKHELDDEGKCSECPFWHTEAETSYEAGL